MDDKAISKLETYDQNKIKNKTKQNFTGNFDIKYTNLDNINNDIIKKINNNDCLKSKTIEYSKNLNKKENVTYKENETKNNNSYNDKELCFIVNENFIEKSKLNNKYKDSFNKNLKLNN